MGNKWCALILVYVILATGVTPQDLVVSSSVGPLGVDAAAATTTKQCGNENNCSKFGEICEPSTGLCVCGSKYITYPPSKDCHAIVEQPCNYDNHCITGAFCEKQTICKCKPESPYVSPDDSECSSGFTIRYNKSVTLIICVLVCSFFSI